MVTSRWNKEQKQINNNNKKKQAGQHNRNSGGTVHNKVNQTQSGSDGSGYSLDNTRHKKVQKNTDFYRVKLFEWSTEQTGNALANNGQWKLSRAFWMKHWADR